jgi:hypothetical protein
VSTLKMQVKIGYRLAGLMLFEGERERRGS